MKNEIKKQINELEKMMNDGSIGRREYAVALLILHDIEPAAPITKQITHWLLRQDWHWVLNEKLAEVFTILAALYVYDDDLVAGEGMAFAMRRLMQSEVRVGGPYADKSGSPQVATNAAIDYFLRTAGTILPSLQKFLRQQDVHDSRQVVIDRHKNSIIVKTSLALRASWQARSQSLPADPFKTDYRAVLAHIQHWIDEFSGPLQPAAQDIWHKMQRADKNREIGLIPFYFADALQSASPFSRPFLRQLGAANFQCWIAYTIYDDFYDDEGSPALLPIANTAMRASLALYQHAAGVRNAKKIISDTFNGLDEANAWELAHARAKIDNDRITIKKLPIYGDHLLLANRAKAHILSGLLQTAALPKISKPRYREIEAGLCHYLIARQLNDDLHDWQEDLAAGHLSPIVALLLRGARVQPDSHRIVALIALLRSYFLDHGLQRGCRLALDHVTQARKCLLASRLLSEENLIYGLLDDLEASLNKSEQVQKQQADFLKTYATIA